MSRYKVGDAVVVQGKRARVVWFREDPSEIEAMDEYIVEFEDKHRQFVTSSTLELQKPQPGHDREHDSDPCHP
jgi:hypothetical protein